MYNDGGDLLRISGGERTKFPKHKHNTHTHTHTVIVSVYIRIVAPPTA